MIADVVGLLLKLLIAPLWLLLALAVAVGQLVEGFAAAADLLQSLDQIDVAR